MSELGIVRKVTSLSGKRGSYEITDNYFLILVKICEPLLRGNRGNFMDATIEDFEMNFNTFLGRPFGASRGSS
ncbi:hypothetical protein [Thermococcus sp.]|uniref:hypothetical protein n=1 Tax=Thermococcus sp. TaxID=35749 RepID=UPI00260311B7|nr:hypothetical protein [Thermococcus sp.]